MCHRFSFSSEALPYRAVYVVLIFWTGMRGAIRDLLWKHSQIGDRSAMSEISATMAARYAQQAAPVFTAPSFGDMPFDKAHTRCRHQHKLSLEAHTSAACEDAAQQQVATSNYSRSGSREGHRTSSCWMSFASAGCERSFHDTS